MPQCGKQWPDAYQRCPDDGIALISHAARGGTTSGGVDVFGFGQLPDKQRPHEKAPIADKPQPDTRDSSDKTVAEAEREQVDEPEEPVPTTRRGGLRKAGIGVGVAGAVLGGVGIYFALDSASAASSLDGYMGEWGQEQIDLEARGERSAKLGWVMGGIGIAGSSPAV